MEQPDPPPIGFNYPFDPEGSQTFSEERDGDGWVVTNGFEKITHSGLKGHPDHEHVHLGEDWVPEAVDSGDGHGRIGEYLVPLAEGLIAGNASGPEQKNLINLRAQSTMTIVAQLL
ncbi:MAG: hypothetical protein GY788_01945 [bacterium]|nr:hypothetical protein [bacterium]